MAGSFSVGEECGQGTPVVLCWRSILENKIKSIHKKCSSSASLRTSSGGERLNLNNNSYRLNTTAADTEYTGESPQNTLSSSPTLSSTTNNFITMLPCVLLETSGGVVCLTPDLLGPLALASANSLLYTQKSTVKSGGGSSSQFPTCFRQYCIKSCFQGKK